MTRNTVAARAIFEAGSLNTEVPQDSTPEQRLEAATNRTVRIAAHRIQECENIWRTELNMDVDRVMAGVHGHIGEADAAHEQLTTYRRTLREGLDKAREDYAAGLIDIEELGSASLIFDQIENKDSSLTRSLNAVRAMAFAKAEDEFGRVIQQEVWPFLVARADAAVARATELSAQVPIYVTDLGEARRQGLQRQWGELLAIVRDEWSPAHTERLRLSQYDNGLLLNYPILSLSQVGGGNPLQTNVKYGFQLWSKFKSPEKLPSTFYDDRYIPSELRLPIAIRLGAGPGMYDAYDASQRFEEWKNRVLAMDTGDSLTAQLALPGCGSDQMYAGMIAPRPMVTLPV